MNKLFYKIGERIEKNPIKILLITILIFAIMIAGAFNVRMATGNETLVNVENEAFQSNYEMEKNFGGDAIMVLFEGKEDALFHQETLKKMWNVEQRLQYNEEIFSFMSPATVVHQVTGKQETQIKEQVLSISDGLEEMAGKLTEIGTELKGKKVPDPKVIEEKLNNLSGMTDVFNKLIAGQNKMGSGVGELQGGLNNLSQGLNGVSLQLKEMSNQAQNNPKLKMQLETLSQKIGESSKGLETMAGKTNSIKEGTQNTSKALGNVSSNLKKETASMKEGLSGGIDPEELKTMADGFITMGENLDQLSEGLNVFHDKSGMMIADFPHNQEELDNILYEEDGELRNAFSDLVIDKEKTLMIVKVKGNLEDEKKDAVFNQVREALDKEEFGEDVSYMVSGKPVLDSALRTEMKTNMKYMVAAAVALMFIILMLVFKVRWRVLSLGVIFIAVLGTLGFMGHISVPMTMVSMAVFPILIGLGIDYSIQFQNRYEEEKSTKTTLGQIGKAVGIAVLATMLGFVSLFASPVPMIQDFGKMLTIGVVISFIASIFLLMPILRSRDLLEEKQWKKFKEVEDTPTIIDRFLQRSTKFVSKYAILVLLVAIIIASLGIYADSKVGVETDIETFMPQDMEALEDIHYLRDRVGSTNQMAIFMEGDNILSQKNLAWIEDTIKEVEKNFPDEIEDVKFIDDLVANVSEEDLSYEDYMDIVEDLPEEQRKMFANEELNKGVILMNVNHMGTEELQEFVKAVKGEIKNAPMEVSITGKSVLDVEMVKGLTDGRVQMTVLGIGLVFIALLLIYRNIFRAFIAVFPIILIVGMSGGIMYLLGLKYTPITATLGALILGMGTEMTIILLERYLEERKAGKEKLESMLITVERVGKATLASGLTTIGGFSVLMLSKFVILKDFGLMTVINISLALISTFIILPALIMVMDQVILSKKEKKKIQEG